MSSQHEDPPTNLVKAPPIPPPPPAGEVPAGFRELVFYSLLTGLCPLIPLPLLDDWVRDLLRRRLVRDLAARGGLSLAAGPVKTLACGDTSVSATGCLRGLVVLLAVKIVKKIFRKILIFLTIRDCAVTFSQTFHQAYLTRHAVGLGSLAGEPPPADEVRRAIEAAVAEPDHRPIEKMAWRTFRGSWKLLKRGARQLYRGFSRLRRKGRDEKSLLEADLHLEDEEQILKGVVDELTEELLEDTGYLRQLETLFEKHMAAAEGRAAEGRAAGDRAAEDRPDLEKGL